MSIVICPKCKLALDQVDKIYKCENGHAFDCAKEGYVNLLLANQKKSIQPGDNKQMINAREEFLSAGYYDFLLESIESALQAFDLFLPPNQTTIQLLDLGCGSGYYTRNIFKGQTFKKIGIDISKVAVTKAAKKDKASKYLVGSAYDLTIANHSVDLLMNIFSPVSLDELQRVLKPEGILVKVIPIEDHMKEVAELVYDKFIPHESSIIADIQSVPNFKILKEEKLKRTILLTGNDLSNFVAMTPYLYKFKEGQLEALDNLSVTISFQVIIARYNSEN